MSWRRITGATLASLLLLSVALPAMCGNCFQAAPAESCGEKHGAAAKPHSDASISAKCPACGNEVQAIAATTAPSADLLNSANSPNSCAQVAAEPTPLADTRIFASRYDISNGALAAASLHNFFARVPLTSQSTATFAKAQPPRVPAIDFPSILKI